MAFCPKCERDLKEGDTVRVIMTGIFIRPKNMPNNIHAIDVLSEEHIEHLTCEE